MLCNFCVLLEFSSLYVDEFTVVGAYVYGVAVKVVKWADFGVHLVKIISLVTAAPVSHINIKLIIKF
jgi:hypothetical protein